jgi:MinD superfamily P-loop ATPase
MAGAVAYVEVDRRCCDLCGACVAVCAPLALRIEGEELTYDAALCTACGDCLITCPVEALAAVD